MNFFVFARNKISSIPSNYETFTERNFKS